MSKKLTMHVKIAISKLMMNSSVEIIAENCNYFSIYFHKLFGKQKHHTVKGLDCRCLAIYFHKLFGKHHTVKGSDCRCLAIYFHKLFGKHHTVKGSDCRCLAHDAFGKISYYILFNTK